MSEQLGDLTEEAEIPCEKCMHSSIPGRDTPYNFICANPELIDKLSRRHKKENRKYISEVRAIESCREADWQYFIKDEDDLNEF